MGTASNPEVEFEQRHRPRYPLKMRGQARPAANNRVGSFPVATGNISLGGMLLFCPADAGAVLQPGDVLTVSFTETSGAGDVTVRGRMVWKRPHVWANELLPKGTGDLFAFGLAFEETAEADIRRLHDPASSRYPSLD